MQDSRYWQLVIYLVEHSSKGSVGIVLNRPANFRVADVYDSSKLKSEGRVFANQQLCALSHCTTGM